MRVTGYSNVRQVDNLTIAAVFVDDSRPFTRKIKPRPPIILAPISNGLIATRNVIAEVNYNRNFRQLHKICAENFSTDGGENACSLLDGRNFACGKWKRARLKRNNRLDFIGFNCRTPAGTAARRMCYQNSVAAFLKNFNHCIDNNFFVSWKARRHLMKKLS